MFIPRTSLFPPTAIGACVLFACFLPWAHAAPTLTINTTELDLGTVERGTVARTSVTLTNVGDEPLELKDIKSSCPCTTAELPPLNKRVIAPGASLELPIAYDTKDRYGDVGSTIVLYTNDPKQPTTLVNLGLTVESLVVYSPDTGVAWSLAPRGGTVTTPLTIMAGDETASIELLELSMEKPGVTPNAETTVENNRSQINVQFTIDPDVPMGMMENQVHARVRIGEKETTVSVAVRGGIIGDVLITPPAIFSPRTAYRQGSRISEITVRSSHPGQSAPELLGVEVVGPLQTAWKANAAEKTYVITVSSASDAPGGPQSGLVYVMTRSADDPIVAVPVYFRAAEAVAARPDHAVLHAANPTQRINLHHPTKEPFRILNVHFDPQVVSANIVPPDTSDAATAVDIALAENAQQDKRTSTVVTIETDWPGAEAIAIPILIRN